MKRKETEQPYAHQVVKALVQKTWATMNQLLGKSEIADFIDKHTRQNYTYVAQNIKPIPFSLTREIPSSQFEGKYTLHFTYAEGARDPLLTKFSIESGNSSVDIPIHSLSDIPPQSSVVLNRKSSGQQPKEVGQGSLTQQNKI